MADSYIQNVPGAVSYISPSSNTSTEILLRALDDRNKKYEAQLNAIAENENLLSQMKYRDPDRPGLLKRAAGIASDLESEIQDKYEGDYAAAGARKLVANRLAQEKGDFMAAQQKYEEEAPYRQLYANLNATGELATKFNPVTGKSEVVNPFAQAAYDSEGRRIDNTIDYSDIKKRGDYLGWIDKNIMESINKKMEEKGFKVDRLNKIPFTYVSKQGRTVGLSPEEAVKLVDADMANYFLENNPVYSFSYGNNPEVAKDYLKKAIYNKAVQQEATNYGIIKDEFGMSLAKQLAQQPAPSNVTSEPAPSSKVIMGKATDLIRQITTEKDPNKRSQLRMQLSDLKKVLSPTEAKAFDEVINYTPKNAKKTTYNILKYTSPEDLYSSYTVAGFEIDKQFTTPFKKMAVYKLKSMMLHSDRLGNRVSTQDIMSDLRSTKAEKAVMLQYNSLWNDAMYHLQNRRTLYFKNKEIFEDIDKRIEGSGDASNLYTKRTTYKFTDPTVIENANKVLRAINPSSYDIELTDENGSPTKTDKHLKMNLAQKMVSDINKVNLVGMIPGSSTGTKAPSLIVQIPGYGTNVIVTPKAGDKSTDDLFTTLFQNVKGNEQVYNELAGSYSKWAYQYNPGYANFIRKNPQYNRFLKYNKLKDSPEAFNAFTDAIYQNNVQ